MTDVTLVVMAKAPVVGTVKTRLGTSIGMEHAAALQRAFTLDWLDRPFDGPRLLAFAGRDDELTGYALAAGWRIVGQRGADLGEKMHAALEAARGPAILVGTDTPSLPMAVLEEARTALSSHDFVLGPSGDGGYYLIGARRPVLEVFDGMTWSHEHVMADQVERLRDRDLSLHTLPYWYDVDNVADLRWLGVHCLGSASGLVPYYPERTLHYLAMLGSLTPGAR